MPGDLGGHDLLITMLAKLFKIGVAPTITLTEIATAGTSTLHVSHTDALKACAGMPLLWFDGGPDGGDPEIGNEPGPIAVLAADTATNTITLSYNGRPYGLTGLHSDHQAGAKAALNLFPDAPNETGPAIANDAPFWWVWVINERINQAFQAGVAGTRIGPSRQNRRLVMICRESQIEQPEADTDADVMDTNVYAYITQESARSIMGPVLVALAGDPYLKLNGVNHIAGMGEGGENVISVDWAKFSRAEGQTPILQVIAQVITRSQI